MTYTSDQIIANRELWLSELESGKWNQHRNELCNKEKIAFCCLASVLSADEENNRDYKTFLKLSHDGHGRLIDLNDKDNLSFPEIAARVRANPDQFFKPLSEGEGT